MLDGQYVRSYNLQFRAIVAVGSAPDPVFSCFDLHFDSGNILPEGYLNPK